MPIPLSSPDFYAQHSPFGAFASFTLGRLGHKGGFGLELCGPADQDVYIGRVQNGNAVALPFYARAQGNEAAAYTGDTEPGTRARSGGWQTFASNQITRTMGWATDSWQAENLTFTLLSPFGAIPALETLGDNELRRHLCPAILAEVTLDNTESDTEAWAFFGVGGGDPYRPLSDYDKDLPGFACQTQWGFAVQTGPNASHKPGDIREVASWNIQAAVTAACENPDKPADLHRLANRGTVLLRVPPRQTRTYTLALGFYRGGVATSGIAASYLYSRIFADIEAVLSYATAFADVYKKCAHDRDRELDSTSLSPDRKALLAHATHSYYGATMMLHDEKNAVARAPFAPPPPNAFLHRPLWVVNEGEYKMLNTFDLTVDHAFWEMRYHPWSLKNTLDLFVSRYSYRDEVQNALDPARPTFQGGISFTHDMGVANQFSPPGYSSYERANLDDCFSYMTQEQLCNWCLCAALYGLPNLPKNKGDVLWLAARRSILHECLHSLCARDSAKSETEDGVMSLDSSRCEIGAEITTYDSLDPSLGQARANLYIAVKCWAAYLALSRCFQVLGEGDKAAEAEEQAARAAATVTAEWNTDEGVFPAVFEKENPGWHAKIVPAIEGLAYPPLWGDSGAVSEGGPYGELVCLLRRHLQTVLVSGVCVDATSGGIRLSSSADNTWMSKIFLNQWVAENVLHTPLSPDYDTAHLKWQTDGACRDFAFTDQVRASDGGDLGSRYYPRGVTAVLWLPPA